MLAGVEGRQSQGCSAGLVLRSCARWLGGSASAWLRHQVLMRAFL